MAYRRFGIYTEPHVADPVWITPVAEILPDGSSVAYGDATQIRDAVWDLQFQLGVQSGRTAENCRTQMYLESIGWSREQMKEWQLFNPEPSRRANGNK